MSKILDFITKSKNDKNFAQAYLKETYSKLEKQKNNNAYVTLVKDYKYVIDNSKSLINKIPYAIKDNINALDTITTGGSLFFKNYNSPYSATVIDNLNKAGAIPVAKANLDEFGLGGTGTFSSYGHVYNPVDKNRITSGSSSGSAVLVANNSVIFALGTDTGDSIRKPASYNGIIGYKPTYGLVSRYGVFPYAPSFDHVGVLTKSVTDAAIVSDVMISYDDKDFTSQNIKPLELYKNIGCFKPSSKIAVFKNVIEYMQPQEKQLFLSTIKEKFNNLKIDLIDYPIELIRLIPSVYKIVSYSEAVSCYQNITGIVFGEKENGKGFDEKIIKTRSKNFGKELKRRFVIGSFCTLEENYEDIFLKAKKIRTLIIKATEDIFKKYDFILMPGSSSIAPLIEDLKSKKYQDTEVDDYLQIANFGGYPSITVPMGEIDKNPIGINIMGKINEDAKVLSFAKYINNKLNGGD